MPSRAGRSYANVTATLALVVALGGTAYAAITVTGANVKDGSLTGRDLADRSVGRRDLGRRVLSGITGPAGPQGPVGPHGPAGPHGAKGETGPHGVAGPHGPAGPQGPRGETGAHGAHGAPGERGPQGEHGAHGAAATSLFATVVSRGSFNPDAPGEKGVESIERYQDGQVRVTFDRDLTGCVAQATTGSPGTLVVIRQVPLRDNGVTVALTSTQGILTSGSFFLSVFC